MPLFGVFSILSDLVVSMSRARPRPLNLETETFERRDRDETETHKISSRDRSRDETRSRDLHHCPLVGLEPMVASIQSLIVLPMLRYAN